MKSRPLLVAAAAAASLAAAWFVVETRFLSPQRRLAALFGGLGGLATVSKPDGVEAFRIGPPSEFDHSLDDHPIIAGPVVVPRDIAGRISDVLASPDSYFWDAAKACEPTPGVRLSFRRADDRVDVLLCFECNILTVYRGGILTGGEDFDDVRPVLVRAAKVLFPEDEVIQTLEEPL